LWQEEQGKLVVEQQKLANLMASKRLGAALRRALRLSQPCTALKILKRLDHETMREPVLSLDRPALDQLLGKPEKMFFARSRSGQKSKISTFFLIFFN
jgi:hypothetical protein